MGADADWHQHSGVAPVGILNGRDNLAGFHVEDTPVLVPPKFPLRTVPVINRWSLPCFPRKSCIALGTRKSGMASRQTSPA